MFNAMSNTTRTHYTPEQQKANRDKATKRFVAGTVSAASGFPVVGTTLYNMSQNDQNPTITTPSITVAEPNITLEEPMELPPIQGPILPEVVITAPKKNKTNNQITFVDWLKKTGTDSSFANRKTLAQKYGINNYTGTYDQNIQLWKRLSADPEFASKYTGRRGVIGV